MCEICGSGCPGAVCRDCIANHRIVHPSVRPCIDCGKEIHHGYVSIKGRCIDCKESRQVLTAFV